jgi:hypothetical protein
MMEAVSSSETLVNIYQSTLGYVPEDSHLQKPDMPQQRYSEQHQDLYLEKTGNALL